MFIKWDMCVMGKDLECTRIKVIAYSGFKANERPLYFILGQQKMEVKEVLDRWYGQEHDYFKVLADNRREYLLKWHRVLDIWSLAKAMEGI